MIELPTPKQRTFAEFLAGVGLMRIGLERQGWKIAFSNDICPDKYEMYAAHFEDADDHFVVEDIYKLDEKDVPTSTLATASFPCNDFSLAGAR
jgi:DNA (cytosine-5)-methyltransferase 1